ncbi:MAG: hypothetical protein ACI9U2_002439 [Bradymonadia bacterium]|jgi:hypothetical protein
MRQDDDDDLPETFAATAAPSGTALPRAQPIDHELPARYTIQGTTGSGGVGVVYRAFDAQMERPVFDPDGGQRSDLVSLSASRKAAAVDHELARSV